MVYNTKKKPLEESSGFLFYCKQSFILTKLDNIGNIAIQSGTDAVQDIAIVANHAILIISINRLKLYIHAFSELISGYAAFAQIAIYS